MNYMSASSFLSVFPHTLPVWVCGPDVPLAFNANGGDLSSAPSCGEKQYSSDLIDIPCIEAVADTASEC